MNFRTRISGVAALALAFWLPAFGQSGGPFTATGNTCSTVTWSQDALQKYPTIGAACQDVLQRGGKSYVKFTGEVVGVADGGRKLTIDFKGGGVFTVSTPENMNVSINKQRTRVRDLRRGDQLSFYIPQDRLTVVDVFDGDAATAAVQELPIEPTPPPPEPVAAAPAPQATQAPRPAQAAPAPQAAQAQPPAPAPAQTAPAPAPRPTPAPVQVPAPPPTSSLGTIGWVALAAVVLIAGALLIRRSMRKTT
jgi:hypothetical protein